MQIANPIYDAVFKRLMENERVARFFIGTLLDETVASITVAPHEYTYANEGYTPEKWLSLQQPYSVAKKNFTPEELANYQKMISLLRYDYVAVFRDAKGKHKKALIEVQKASTPVDTLRFRNYIAEQYKRTEKVLIDGVETDRPLPIITIYVLGFERKELNAVVVRAGGRPYYDVLGKKEMHDVESDFVECLTHETYIVQIPRIEGKMGNSLERLLCIFEQKHFLSDYEMLKDFPYETKDIEEEICLMLDILLHAGANPEIRKQIEQEWWALQYQDQFLGELLRQRIAIAEKDNAIATALAEKDAAQAEKATAIAEKEAAQAEKETAQAEMQAAQAIAAKQAAYIAELENKIKNNNS